MVVRIFDIYEGDTFLFRGQTKDVKRHFRCDANMLNYYAVNNSLWKGKYTVKVHSESGLPDLVKWNVMNGTEVIFTGTNVEIRNRFGMYKCFSASQYYQRGLKIKRKYSIQPSTETAKRKKVKYDVPYEEIVRMLDINHNAYVRSNEKEIQSKLKDDGIITTITRCSDGKGCVLWANS